MNNPIEIIMLKGAPASCKSSWAREFVSENPNNWVIVNNDQIRNMINGSVYSEGYEKLIHSMRVSLIRTALNFKKNLVIDNINAGSKNWNDMVKICNSIPGTYKMYEKCFYEELETLIERDAKREGIACVGQEVISEFFKKLGGKGFKKYVPREILINNEIIYHGPKQQNKNLFKCVVCDLDGTCSLFNKPDHPEQHLGAHVRNPYFAEYCQNDSINEPVADVIKRMATDHKIIFMSGRKDSYRPQTQSFLNKHFPGIEYSLFMRKADDNRGDEIIKKELYHEHVEPYYFVNFWIDDRSKVISMVRNKLGLNVWQVHPGDF